MVSLDQIKNKIHLCQKILQDTHTKYIQIYSEDLDHFGDIGKIRESVRELSDLCEENYCEICPASYMNTMKYHSFFHMVGIYQEEDYHCYYHKKIDNTFINSLDLIDKTEKISSDFLACINNDMNKIRGLVN